MSKTNNTTKEKRPIGGEMPTLPVMTKTPTELMAKSNEVADVCRTIISKAYTVIQKKKYVRVEGWEAIAAAHECHVSAHSAKREYDNKGELIGYTAIASVRNKFGQEIGTGDGFVGFDETDRKGVNTWKLRDEYAGRAMAQTRAISRACRAIFAHVLVLLDDGYSTTPAEEVRDTTPEKYVQQTPSKYPPKKPKRKSKDRMTLEARFTVLYVQLPDEMKTGKHKKVIEYLTNYTIDWGEKVVKKAWELGDLLWTRYDEKF